MALTEESQRRDGYSMTIGNDGNKHLTRHRFGQVPALVPQSESSRDGTLGMYSRVLMRGEHSIMICTGRPLDDVRETLIHEALHYLDDLAQIPDRGHDCYWQRRLDRMRVLFPVTAWGRSPLTSA